MRRSPRPASSLALLLALAAAPSTALACGGFFSTASPVDQAAERVIFRQTDAETVESIIDIRYAGDPNAFAWIVPVPGKAESLSPYPVEVFEALDRATTPRLQPACAELGGIDSPSQDAGEPGAPAPDAGAEAPPPVIIQSHDVVGGYDTYTLLATDSAALLSWLQKNGYRVPDTMAPFIDLYIGQGLSFLVAKLLPGKGIEAIKPLRMVYKSGNPMVPLRLTSIAAVPEMGVKVFVLGASRYTVADVGELEVPQSELRYDNDTGNGNWEAAVARTIDRNGGEGMVVDYAGSAANTQANVDPTAIVDFTDEPAAATRQALDDLFKDMAYVTRLYGRYSPEEMGRDLVFKPAPELPNVGTDRNLNPEQTVGCGNPRPEDTPCAYVACGAGGLCVMTPDDNGVLIPACACVDGATARAMPEMTTAGNSVVACVDTRMDVNPVGPVKPPVVDPGQVDPSIDVNTPPLADPCTTSACGPHGACLALNGQQTCQCEHSYVAVAAVDNAGAVHVACRASDKVPDDFYQRTLPEPKLPYPGHAALHARITNNGCAVTGAPVETPRAPWALFGLGLLGLGGLAARWKRRRAG